ncbi:MAG: cysteine desulfurase [Desulfobulbaceae bacterium]|uniref:cysteine desulfurase n=1 Tax=Candidatus Desulfobia pelagia TaxID=2841692 RepID=A0A8J6NA33_9BACT|nr:cysteine desulfurase [Candidatus Desulfobia pelagia]
MIKPIYLDYNGTTPHDPEVVNTMLPFLKEHFGNPSSSHYYGIVPTEGVEKARKQVANLLKCQPEEIIFTSGGTESNNHAIQGIAFSLRDKGNHIISSQVEHPAVLEVCKYLERFGFETTYLPVDEYGLVDPVDLEAAIKPETILFTIMHANNEVGTLQPISEFSKIARKHQIIMHTDAAQSVGKVPTDVNSLGVDLLSIAGHKLYAPKGVGVLYVRQSIDLWKFCHGAGQENRARAGTENVVGIVGLGQACEIAGRNLLDSIKKMENLRDLLHEGLFSQLDDIRLNGHPKQRLPNTLSVSVKGLEANKVLEKIKGEVAASAGAACHSGGVDVSHVLKAMQVPLEWAKGTLRFSVGRMTTTEQIEHTIEIVVKAIKNQPGPLEIS